MSGGREESGVGERYLCHWPSRERDLDSALTHSLEDEGEGERRRAQRGGRGGGRSRERERVAWMRERKGTQTLPTSPIPAN